MITIKNLGLQDYAQTWEEMKKFTVSRESTTPDELWLLEHHAVYTQGQAGKAEHVLNTKGIPIVQSDRGGQVTYHGPGQLVVYTLIDIQRRNLGIRTFVSKLEQSLIQLLKQHYGILATIHCGAPGVYVNEKKIASIGLRVKNGCTYHGIALNVAMDLTPFDGINPCGYETLKMTQMSEFVDDISIGKVAQQFTQELLSILGHKL